MLFRHAPCTQSVLVDPRPLVSGWKDQVQQKDPGDSPTSTVQLPPSPSPSQQLHPGQVTLGLE